MKILIVRLSSLGDVVHNMPMVADILRHHPDAQIDWVVEEAFVDLVALNQGVANVIPIALRRWKKQCRKSATRSAACSEIAAFHRRLREQSYDCVFDTQGLLKSSIVMRMAKLAPGGKRIGLANGTEGCGYEGLSRLFHHESIAVDRYTHAVARARRVSAAHLGYVCESAADFDMASPEIQRPAWMPAAYAVFFHASARASKRWPEDAWIEIGSFVKGLGLQILLPWGNPAEKLAAERLAAAMPNARVLPKLSMQEAILLAQRAHLVVGIDTGLTHIAAASHRPTVEIYCDSPRWNTECNWSDNVLNLGDAGSPPSVSEVR
ncbi:MAG: waaC, partial [Hyphomicrobiales bacterium]|nr:waaC [Hyphomicrobiales bacterium]